MFLSPAVACVTVFCTDLCRGVLAAKIGGWRDLVVWGTHSLWHTVFVGLIGKAVNQERSKLLRLACKNVSDININFSETREVI